MSQENKKTYTEKEVIALMSEMFGYGTAFGKIVGCVSDHPQEGAKAITKCIPLAFMSLQSGDLDKLLIIEY